MLSTRKAASAMLILMLLLIVTVVIIVIFSPSDYRQSLLEEDSDKISSGSVIIFETNDIELSKSDLDMDSEYISLHDIDLDRAAHKKDVQIESSFVISNSFIKDNFAEFSFTSGEELQNMYLTFYVIKKEGSGSIKVLLNNEKISMISPEAGEKVTVTIPLDLITDGTNEVVLKATYPIAIWQKNSYSIADLRAFMTERSNLDKIEQTFILEKSSSFENPVLQAYITKQSYSVDNSRITLTLNNNLVFQGAPSIVNDNQLPGAFLLPLNANQLEDGLNTLLWEIDAGGAYSIDFIKLKYQTLEESEEDEDAIFKFNIDSEDYRKVRSTRYDCVLSFESDSLNEEFEFILNSETTNAAISSSEISFNVCSQLNEGLNTLKLYSEEDILFSNIKLEVKR